MDLTGKQFNKILKKQCDMVGIDWERFFKPYLTGKEMPKNWYHKYSWTESQQEAFIEWLTNYVRKLRPILSKRQARKYAGMYNLDYGWKVKEGA